MNTNYIINLTGKIIFFLGLLLLLPLAVAIIYGETAVILPYSLIIGSFLLVGSFSFVFKPKDKTIRTREGLVIAGLSWIIVSLLGALPMCLTGDIPNYIDAVFEISSGFTTTGATILTEIETLSHAGLFWRSLTHWVGGMGVLVFVLALLPATDPQSMHIMRAEMPGPQVGKLVARLRLTAQLLYVIYLALSFIEFILLLFGGMPVFDSIVTSFATAGTGGFSVRNGGIADYNSAYIEVVLTVFMLIFSINFNLYYLILVGNIRDALKSEELHWFLIIILVATGSITANTLLSGYYANFGEALRYSSFQVASLVSSTGFVTANFDAWPVFSQTILVTLMFIGACAGSTGGGLKLSRIIVLCKTAFQRIKKQISPHSVTLIRLEGKAVDASTRHDITAYLFTFVIIFVVSLFIITSNTHLNASECFTSVLSCLNNDGPYLTQNAMSANFAAFNPVSKIVLIFDMIAGRLEFFPLLAVFAPRAWTKR